MSNSFHKVYGIFGIGNDPEVQYTPSGLAIAKFSGASDFNFKKDDEWVTETEWTRMVAFGRSAERIGEKMKKGTQVYVEGRLKTNKWEDKDGNTRYNTDLIVNVIKFLKNYNGEGQGYSGGAPKDQYIPPNAQQPTGSSNNDDDDIPF